jgi:hypothetical protein
MRILLSALIGVVLLVPVVQAQTPSALESDPTGWQNLLADTTMKGWIRGPLWAVGQLRAGSMDEPSPWKLDPATGILLCEGDKAGHEWMRFATELADFLYHVEWRVAKVEGATAYNSGVFIRSSADAAVWHQAQGTPAGGFLFGATPVNGAIQRVNLRESMSENRLKPAGEWNTYEVRAVGRVISLWVNGAVTSEFKDCEVPRGYVGLEAEGYRVEYRNVQLKPIVETR